MKKNKMDHRGEIGSLDRASGYAMNARPNPSQRQRKKEHQWLPGGLQKCILIVPTLCVCLTFLHHFSNWHFVNVRHVTQD